MAARVSILKMAFEIYGPRTHITSNGIHFILSIKATEIVMMKFILGQCMNSKWLPGGHVEILVIATPPDGHML